MIEKDSVNKKEYKYDLFISHASEDKDDFVRLLVNNLKQAGAKVWYDEDAMNVGDSLRRSINEGLKTSRSAIVVLSRNYFLKKWTNFELNGLFSFNEPDMRKILPIWHNVSADEIREYDSMVADTVAIQSNLEMVTIVERIMRSLNTQVNGEEASLVISSQKQFQDKPENELLKAYIQNNNIHGVFKNRSERQLTFEDSDSNPLLVKAKSTIVYLRSEKKRSSRSKREYSKFKLMAMDINSLEERILTDQKPSYDGNDRSFELLSPRSLTISLDQSKVLFLIEKYVTGSQLVQVDIVSGRYQELFSAERFEFIKSGEFKSLLLVGVSEARDRGRMLYYKVCDWEGNVIKEFKDYEEFMTFRSSALSYD